MPADLRVDLLELEPDLARYLPAAQQAWLRRLVVPAREISGELDFGELLREAGAFGAILCRGMLVYRVRLGEQTTLQLFGPGDPVPLNGSPKSSLVVETACTAAAETRIALLDDHFLAAAQRCPRLFLGLQAKSLDVFERVTLQLALCQLPRVSDRLLALFWLLAETWGRMTASGVSLPLSLTHDALGGMVGARRPTVTLALGELSDRGALIRQDRGWLLLEELAPPQPDTTHAELPLLLDHAPTAWTREASADPTPTGPHAELMESIVRLRQEHLVSRQRVQERLAAVHTSRQRIAERRAGKARVNPPRAPSS